MRGHEHCGAAVARVAYDVQGRLGAQRIDAVERLVEQKHGWVVECGQHDGHPASHAVAEAGGDSVRGRTEVEVDVLDDHGKVEELARMLAGETVTPAALRHAAEMRARGHKPAGPEA